MGIFSMEVCVWGHCNKAQGGEGRGPESLFSPWKFLEFCGLKWMFCWLTHWDLHHPVSLDEEDASFPLQGETSPVSSWVAKKIKD